VRQTLCDTYGKRIEQRSGESEGCGHVTHINAGYGIVPHFDGKGNKNDYKGYGLFAHPKGGSEYAEQQNNQRNNEIVHSQTPDKPVALELAGSFQEGQNSNINGFAVVHNPECSAYHQDKNDDIGLIHKSVEEGREYLPRLRVVSGIAERVGCYNLPWRAIYFNCSAFVATTRNYPGKESGKENKIKDDYECMRKLPGFAHNTCFEGKNKQLRRNACSRHTNAQCK